ncbi:MAG: orotate phosphoribosyltransferase [Candidatus Hodarchaeales archaeon]
MINLKDTEIQELVKILQSVDVLQFGNFTLKDGSISPVYIDLRVLPNFPQEFKAIIKLTSNYMRRSGIDQEFDGIIAPPLAGIPLGTALALELDKDFYLARIQPKNYGTKKLIEGDIKDKRILLVDDVITSGISKEPILKAILDNGGILAGLFVFVNRISSPDQTTFEKKFDLSLNYLINLKDLLKLT